MQEERAGSRRAAAAAHSVAAKWEKIWTIAPTIFDAHLTELCKQAVAEETGEPTTIYSGPSIRREWQSLCRRS